MSEEATAVAEQGLEARLTPEVTPVVEQVDERSTAKKIADLYFAPKGFEKSGKLYERLGIKFAKKVCPTFGDYVNAIVRKFNPDHRLIKNVDGVRDWEKWTRVYETVHLPFAIAMTSGMGFQLANGDYKGAAVTGAINTVVNIYPIMLQRYNRSRLYRVMDRDSKQ